MTEYDLNAPPNQMRRSDRSMEPDEIRSMLEQAAFGVLATEHAGQPFLNSNLFVYDPQAHALYLHTARVGRTRANVEAGSQICFGVSEMGRLLPAEEALEFSVEYRGVTVFGPARVVSDPAEKEHGLQLLLDKYFPHLRPGEHYRPITGEELERTAVYRVDIEHWSGKRKQVEADFPGAFLYGEAHGP